MSEGEHMQRYMQQLVGRKITEAGVTHDTDEDQFWPFFKLDDGSKIEVSMDPEGNGPGFLFGLPAVN